MDIAALILAILATISFVFSTRPAQSLPWLGIGLTLLASSWICQCIHLTHTWVVAH